ncbi:hypothetical protein PSHT_00471 [Puccinia striiformis]|uniref:Uncharacterized protein n=1 Tax=Puccinia striiformis TaxID=27350 RepID=A0A2S4WN68_9BASI|nr:hypothetical protein PSHT_00471 [Puccinia striiformis]
MAWHAFLILSSLCIPCQSMDDFDFGFGFDWHDEPPTLDDVLAPFGSAPVPVPHPSGVADQLSIPLHQACRSLQPRIHPDGGDEYTQHSHWAGSSYQEPRVDKSPQNEMAEVEEFYHHQLDPTITSSSSSSLRPTIVHENTTPSTPPNRVETLPPSQNIPHHIINQSEENIIIRPQDHILVENLPLNGHPQQPGPPTVDMSVSEQLPEPPTGVGKSRVGGRDNPRKQQPPPIMVDRLSPLGTAESVRRSADPVHRLPSRCCRIHARTCLDFGPSSPKRQKGQAVNRVCHHIPHSHSLNQCHHTNLLPSHQRTLQLPRTSNPLSTAEMAENIPGRTAEMRTRTPLVINNLHSGPLHHACMCRMHTALDRDKRRTNKRLHAASVDPIHMERLRAGLPYYCQHGQGNRYHTPGPPRVDRYPTPNLGPQSHRIDDEDIMNTGINRHYPRLIPAAHYPIHPREPTAHHSGIPFTRLIFSAQVFNIDPKSQKDQRIIGAIVSLIDQHKKVLFIDEMDTDEAYRKFIHVHQASQPSNNNLPENGHLSALPVSINGRKLVSESTHIYWSQRGLWRRYYQHKSGLDFRDLDLQDHLGLQSDDLIDRLLLFVLYIDILTSVIVSLDPSVSDNHDNSDHIKNAVSHFPSILKSLSNTSGSPSSSKRRKRKRVSIVWECIKKWIVMDDDHRRLRKILFSHRHKQVSRPFFDLLFLLLYRAFKSLGCW